MVVLKQHGLGLDCERLCALHGAVQAALCTVAEAVGISVQARIHKEDLRVEFDRA